jgi:DNA-binding NtrC family response regulator
MQTILLVEDDNEVRQLVGAMLRRGGFRLIQANGGEEAIARVADAKGRVDLMVTDVVMPRMSGPDLSATLSALYPGLKVIYMSGYLDDQLRAHGLSYRAPNFLQKPFTQEALIRKIREVLAGPPAKRSAAASASASGRGFPAVRDLHS